MTAPRSRASTGGSGAAGTGRSDERFTPRAHDLDPAGAFTDVHPGENVYPTQSRSATRRNEYMGVRVPGEGRAATTTASTPSQRRGISRREWRVETVEDQSKDVARWQLEFTKMQRRAKAAEDDNTRLKAMHDDMHARLEGEHHARTALELRLKDVFAAPVVKEALASHPAGTTRRDDPYGMGNVLRAGEDTDGSETAMLVFKALEDRITRDRDALEAANAREVRLATMLRHSETSKLAAYAEAEKHRRELEAHVAKLRVDRAIREGVEKDLESSRSAEETLRITREKLATLTLEAETLRMNEKHREETQAAAVKAAVKKALDETVSEATLEAKRLSEALAKVRTEHGEQDWAHDREKETTRKGYEHAIAAVLQNKEDLERELKFSRKDGRRADIERARVADEAAAVVEKAVAQREWALEVLDRAVDAEEEFAKHLHYEFYRTHLLAMPETVTLDDDGGGGQSLHEVCARARTEWEREICELRGDLASLRRDVGAAAMAIDAARDAGIAEGWAQAADKVDRAAEMADGVAWAAMQRVAESVRGGAAGARTEAATGEATLRLKQYLRTYDEGTFDPSKYSTRGGTASGTAAAKESAKEPPQMELNKSELEKPKPPGDDEIPPPGPEEKVGFKAAMWREQAKQKASEREAAKRAYEAELAAKAVAAGRSAPAPLSPKVDNGVDKVLFDKVLFAEPAASARSSKKPPRTLASIAGTPGPRTAHLPQAHDGHTAFHTPKSVYTPSKSATKVIASLARNLRF